MSESAKENWSSGSAYEGYVGRWSRRVAQDFIGWLAVGPGLAWADVGCGTGAMTSCILQKAEPASVRAIDNGMQMMRHFWDVVAEQFPGAGLDEAERFPARAWAVQGTVPRVS